jgi:hypothetical protein
MLASAEREQEHPHGQVSRQVESAGRVQPHQVGRLVRFDWHNGHCRCGVNGIQDLLRRHPVERWKDGSQRLVSGHQVCESQPQSVTIQLARQPERNRNVVASAAACDLVEEPHSALREGDRQHRRARHPAHRLAGRAVGVQLLGHAGRGGRVEKISHAELDTKRGPQPLDQRRRHQRVAAAAEEVVVCCKPGQAERGRENAPDEVGPRVG